MVGEGDVPCCVGILLAWELDVQDPGDFSAAGEAGFRGVFGIIIGWWVGGIILGWWDGWRRGVDI